jgi:natural product biosynthesis luciferase-like monooxygenase protein
MTTNPLDCMLMGDNALLLQCADTLRERGHRVVAIVSGDDAIRAWAAPFGIPVHAPSDELGTKIAGLRYDWFFGIANLRGVPEELWRAARRGAANFHDGPLPERAGFNAPSWAILSGATRHAVTWHALASGPHEGGTYLRREFDLRPDETTFTLNTRCFELGIETFDELLRSIEQGTAVPEPQDVARRACHGKLDRPDAGATLRFDRPAAELIALVRALDCGPGYPNPLLLPKLRTETGVYCVTALRGLESAGRLEPPGSVISVEGQSAVIAAADGPVELLRIVRACGTEVAAADILCAGTRLPLLSDAQAERLSAVIREIVSYEEYFERRLGQLQPAELPLVPAGTEAPAAGVRTLPLRLPDSIDGDDWIAGLAAYLARCTGQPRFDLGYADDELTALASEAPGYLASAVPLRVEAADGTSAAALADKVRTELAELRARRTYLADLVARRPGLTAPQYRIGVACSAQPSPSHAIGDCALTFVVPRKGADAIVAFDEGRISLKAAEALVRRVRAAFSALAVQPDARIADLPVMSDEERAQVLYEWNRSECAYDRSACVHTLVEHQVDATPDAVALVFEDQTLSYRELDARANRVAHALRVAGVTPDAPVGLYVRRSPDLVVGALGIQKAGGAYVPLDPSYPAARLRFMLEDSGARVVLTQRDLRAAIPAAAGTVICMEDEAVRLAPATRPDGGAAAGNLAYVIYTSGSTGRPKGVMIEHRNVVNFFAGMDARVARPSGSQPVWLAVTSLSFDISVLELFWTLARGFKVVIASDEHRPAVRAAGSVRPMDFGLFYWGNDDGPGPNKYRLLLEGAKFADTHGFHAVWTPERHFHAFGGPYPNPAVTGAAVAAVTRNVQVRAGSCVLPLHHPARVAEEWAVLDNLSGGRVAVAIASGWMPEDFLLRPENAPPRNKASMIRDIDVLRRLWRGEAVPFDSPTGAQIPVVTQPRPVQKELPIWVTTAGNPDTYREAARLGANVLTHLLGQSIDEVGQKIRIYRDTLAELGRNPADFRVTLMLHTLVGEDRDAVRELARGPMKEYLRSAAALIKQYAWEFPAFKKPAGVDKPWEIDLRTLSAEEMDAILDFAFQRYFDDSGLFGTAEDAVARVEHLKEIGVDEIACLIDFGIASDVALSGLRQLAEVVRRTSRPGAVPAEADYGVAAQIVRHGATHIQCTPSMARMLLMDDDARKALAGVGHLFVGGEALPGPLVAELKRLGCARVENMYGPTETTIWSSTQAAEPIEGFVPLGKPIANTQLYVLDDERRPVPPGTPGELYIGGDGVARGYLHREDLTRERFLPDPFRAGGRMYRTGDLVRHTEEGALQFLGRIDHQVKVRGYRIELGEIEAKLAAHPGVREVVVMAREDTPGDVRLVAYLRFVADPVADDALRAFVQDALPEFMVPAHYVALERFPLTPNAKVDRKALPRPEEARAAASPAPYVAPASEVQRQIAEIYRKVLRVPQIGLSDNFFKLGGHSLLAVQAHRELRANVSPKLTITDIFRFPTVAALAGHIDSGGKPDAPLERVADRATARREALARRRGLRPTREQPS